MSTGNTGFSRGIIFVLSLFTSTIYAEAAVIGNTPVSVRTPALDVRYARGDSMQLRVSGNRDGRFVLRWQVPPELSCLLFRVERAVTEGYRFTEERRWVEIGVIPGLCSLFDTVPYFYE
ncbi:MAG: hypothetical protein KFF77_11610, partial [Bacteroidetes bacterium]|nr:hypothetical protein [Bacteroidota bacterium]